ncbi:hypothetical protein J6590_091122 [Homalodisca vitripennis]|nr:hypothetical protein J6590_091122 [Homalodisca vitripennis]
MGVSASLTSCSRSRSAPSVLACSVLDFKDNPVANFWLLNQAALKPGQFIDALKFRTNTYGTRVAIHRGARTGVTDCWRCYRRARIERHNWMVAHVEDRLRERGAIVG